jgi:hypothetical protein
MSYRRRHRWFRRMALGLAFASVLVAGRASVAAAKFDEGTNGSRYVAAGGWSGQVDPESGIPLSAGIPEGDEQFIDGQAVQVIPYLSGGILTEADAQAAAAEAIRDPYLTDVFVRPGESLGGPDGDEIAIRNALETQTLAAAEAIHDPYLSDIFVRPGESLGGPDGEEIAFANTLVAAAESLHDPIAAVEQESTVVPYTSAGVLGEAVKTMNVAPEKFVPGVTDFPKTSQPAPEFIPGVTDFPKTSQPAPDNRVERGLEQGPQVIPYLSHGMTADDVVGARPDDKADRFAHSDVATPQEVSNSGSTFEWNDALTVGIGALVLALGLGLALGYLRRPRLAGL